MRFRGTLAKDALAVLLDVALAFTRLAPASASVCVFTLSPESLALALKVAGDELQSFARLPLARLFHDVVVQSQANNHIAFSCDVRHLQRALASGKDASAVMLRLLKRDGRSFLCLRTRVRVSLVVVLDAIRHNQPDSRWGLTHRYVGWLVHRRLTLRSCRACPSRCCP